MNSIKLVLALLMGFSTGSASTSFYYQRQLTKERQAMLECQLAWEKYYSLSNQTKTVQPMDSNPSFWQVIKNEVLRMAQAKAQGLVTNEPFTLEQQKHLVYHYEVLPKCQKIKDWEKQMNTLAKE